MKEKTKAEKAKGIKAVVGVPDEMKPIRGIAPLHGNVWLQFYANEPARITVNNGPTMRLQDCGEHWQVII